MSAPLPAELGGTNPFAHVLMMGGVAVAALMLLRHIRADLSGRPGGGGLWRQAGSGGGRDGGDARRWVAPGGGGAGARGLRRRLGVAGRAGAVGADGG